MYSDIEQGTLDRNFYTLYFGFDFDYSGFVVFESRIRNGVKCSKTVLVYAQTTQCLRWVEIGREPEYMVNSCIISSQKKMQSKKVKLSFPLFTQNTVREMPTPGR